ncbi:MAG: hypothetical protein VX529_08185 [Pseudomonadota bacterium]|nr:hypothetical protein [Pseudomonadota bacterium]
MRDVPALAEHLANMVTAHDTPRYRTVLKDNIQFLERELSAALSEARAEGAREERERLARLAEEQDWGICEIDRDVWVVSNSMASWIRSQSNKEG